MSNVLFTLVGPSGCGKTAIIADVVERRLQTKLSILKTITTAVRRNAEDDANYRFISAMEFALIQATGRLIQSVQHGDRLYGNDSADVDAIEARGKHCINAMVEDGVRNFRARGYEVVMIRVIPVGPFKRRSPEREKLDEQRAIFGPAPDAVVVNDFASPTGLPEACAKVEGIILGYLLPRP